MPTYSRLLVLVALFLIGQLGLRAQAVPPGIPQITTAPTGGIRSVGVSSTLTVIATGNAPLSYQWLRGSATSPTAEIPGATSASYTLGSPTAADTAYYSVRVSNSLGSLTTEPVLVAYEQTAGGLARVNLPLIGSSSQAVNAIIPQADGSVLIGGSFTQVGDFSMLGFSRIKADGTVDSEYPQISNTGGYVNAMVRDGSGRILLAGSSITEITEWSYPFNTYTRYGLVRILEDSTVDAAFTSPCSVANSAFTNAIAVEASGTVLLGGSFTNVIGQTGTKYLLRLNGTTGAADPAFAPALTSDVKAIHLLADGKIMVGHGAGLTLLNPDGTPAAGFTYGGGATTVNAIQPLPGGDFLIGRNGTSATLIRITSTGSLVTPFPATGSTGNQTITDILALPSGNFILGGTFTTYNGSTVNRIAHITANGTAASGFNFGTGFGSSGAVSSLALDPDNNLWVGGSFNTYRSQTQRKLACLGTSSSPATDPGAPAPDAYTQYLIDAGIAAARRGTADDPDGDSSTNLDEFQNGTGPANPASAAFRLTTTAIGATITANPVGAGGLYAPGTSVVLTATPAAGFSFSGWLADGATTPNLTNPLTVVMNQNRTLTAYAGLPLGDALDTPALTWTAGGHRLWTGVASPSQDGVDAASVSGLATASQEAWLETTVTGPGVLSLRWSLTTAQTDGAILQLLLNTSPLVQLPATAAGAFNAYNVNVSGTGPQTLRVRLVANFNGGVSPSDVAIVDKFHFGPFTAPTILPPTDITSTSATLRWTEVPSASYYQLELSTEPAFLGAFSKYFYPARDTSSLAVSGLVAGTTYYTRIRAISAINGALSADSATGTFTPAAQQTQTIDFPQPAAKTFGDAPFALSATASSGLPVTFEIVSGPATLAGNLLTLTGGGEVVLRATQAGDGNYFAAPPVERTLSVGAAAQTITFPALPSYPAEPLAYYAPAATASSGLPIALTVESGPAMIVDGMLRVTGTGLVRVTANQPGNASFLPAAPVTREFTAVSPASSASRLKITTLARLPDGSLGIPTGLSGDGSTIVGWANTSAGGREGFRGSSTAAVLTGIGDLPGGPTPPSSEAYAVSADGSVVVGYGTTSGLPNPSGGSTALTQEAIRWTPSGGLVSLGRLPGSIHGSEARGVSGDGSVIVGSARNATAYSEAFRWTSVTGLQSLGFLPGGTTSIAYGVSADGAVIVGAGATATTTELAFRWTSAVGMTALGDLAGGEIRSRANAISADGAVIVGQSTSARGREAFRWTAGGMVGLGDLPGGTFESEALAVSADGSVVVGRASAPSGSYGNEAFIWDAAHGMRSIRDVLSAAALAPGRKFSSATGISSDGRFVTLTGTNQSGAAESWLLDLAAPPPAPATVALIWAEDLPAADPFRADSVVRLGDDTGAHARIDLATHLGSSIGGFNGVEYSGGLLLVPNQGFGGGGTRTHHPAYTDLLVTNVFAYDLDAPAGDLWVTNGNAQQIFRRQAIGSPSLDGLNDYTYNTQQTTAAGRFAFAIQAVGSTIYFSNPSNNPIGLYKMNADGTGITSVLTGTGAGAPVIYDFEVVGTHIYFCDIGASAIRRMNLNGTEVVTLVANVDFPNGIDVTDTAIYWTELNNGRIRRSDLVGGNVEELVTDLLRPRGVVAAPLSLFDRAATPLDSYLADAGVPANLRGPNDDADNDGLDNLIEYALDLNPNGNGGAFTGSLPFTTTTPEYLQFTYRRVRNDVTYSVETSPTPTGGAWTTVGVTQGTPGPDGTTTASIPITPGSQYLRLSVTR